MTAGDAILQVRELRKNFPVDGGRHLVAVDGVSLDLAAGETLALVGESGSGKSTVARCIVRLIEPSGGDVAIDGKSILSLQPRLLAGVYRRIQMVFQDPYASLNPRMSVRQVLDEPLRLHLDLPRAARTARVRELVEMVGLTPLHLDRYPHELSGASASPGRWRSRRTSSSSTSRPHRSTSRCAARSSTCCSTCSSG